jgi:hypothetical protein
VAAAGLAAVGGAVDVAVVCPPPLPPGIATVTLEVLAVMPRSLSIKLTGRPVLFAMEAALWPCCDICRIWAICESLTVSWAGDRGGGGATATAVISGEEYVCEAVRGEMLKVISFEATGELTLGRSGSYRPG